MSKEITQVIVGDLAFQKTITSRGEKDEVVGSAFYSGVAASTIVSDRTVGIVARVGTDFPVNLLKKRGIDVSGVDVIPGGRTAHFTIIEDATGRTFSADFGVAANVDTATFPQQYNHARHIHLATAEPRKQLIWIEHFRKILPGVILSADAFEKFAEESPEETYRVLSSVDLAFLNEKELQLLKTTYPNFSLSIPLILKKGKQGAEYIDNHTHICIKAPQVEVIDTTGAGETLATAFLLLQAKGLSVQASLEQAVKLATKEVTDFGVEHLRPLRANR